MTDQAEPGGAATGASVNPVPMGEPERCAICGGTFAPGAIREYFSTPDNWAIRQWWGPVHTACFAKLTVRDELDLLQPRTSRPIDATCRASLLLQQNINDRNTNEGR